jgi:hypothetical protein
MLLETPSTMGHVQVSRHVRIDLRSSSGCYAVMRPHRGGACRGTSGGERIAEWMILMPGGHAAAWRLKQRVALLVNLTNCHFLRAVSA